MSFLGEVARPTGHIPNRNHAWSKEGSLSAKSKALVSGPFRAEPQQRTHWKGPFERAPEVVASIAQRPVTAEDLTYSGDFTFGDRVSDDVFHETKKFIRKARHRRPVSPSKAPLPDGELVGGTDGTDARDTIAIAERTLEPKSGSGHAIQGESHGPAVTGELAEAHTSDFSGMPGEDARYHQGRPPSSTAEVSSEALAPPTAAQQALHYAQHFEAIPDPPSAPCAYLGKHLRRSSPRKIPQQHGWEDEEEAPGGGLATGDGTNAIHLAHRRNKRRNKNIDVQAKILTALVTGDQVSYLTMESEFRKAQAKTAAGNPWAITMNQTGASMLGDTRGWTRPEPMPEAELEPEAGSKAGGQAGRVSPKKRPHRRWFGYGPAPPVEPEPELEPEPEPEFVPAGFSVHYPAGLVHSQPKPELEPEPEPYKSPIADLPTGTYWLDNFKPKAPPKCTCHPTKGSSGCRLHDPNYKHPAKGLQTPPSWMFKGNTALNEEMAKIKDEYSTYVASGGVVKQAEKKRNAFLLRSFLMLRARLSFSTAGRRGTFSSKETATGSFQLASPCVRCSFCGTVQKPYKEKRGRDYLIDAEGNKIPLPKPEGLDWVEREIINDCGQIGAWDAQTQAGHRDSGDDVSDLLSESEDEEDDLLDDPLALAVIGSAPAPKKPVPGVAKQGEKPCLGLLQRVTLCPRHETACAERLDEVAVSTVLLKSALWRALRDADRARRAHQLRHVIAVGNLSKKGAKFAYKYTKIGAQAVATAAKKEFAKIKDRRAARQAAYAEQRRQPLAAGEQDEVKVGAALHVSATALVSASTGEGMRDLRTGKKLVW
jgi:hypothetical protein